MPFQESATRAILLSSVVFQLALVVQSAAIDNTLSVVSGGGVTVVAFPSLANASHSEPITTGKFAPGEDYGNDLLNKNKLSFLAACTPNATARDELVCEVYRNLTWMLAKRKYEPITADTINQMLEQEDSPSEDQFCDNLAKVLSAIRQKETGREKIQEQNIRRPLETSSVCLHICSSLDVNMIVNVKPICRVLLWGFRLMLLPEKKPDPAAQAAAVIVPPLLPNVKDEDVASQERMKQSVVNAKPEKSTPNSTLSAPEKSASEPAAEQHAPKAVTPPGTLVKLVVTPQKDENDEQDKEEQNDRNLEGINTQQAWDGENASEDTDIENGDGVGSDEYIQEGSNTKVQPDIAKENLQVKDGESGQLAVRMKDLGGPKQAAVQQQEPIVDPFFEENDSNFFPYFLFIMFVCILCYVAYHNKSKLLALALEGRRSSSGRGGFSKGRKHTAAYRKLDSNLEEAITSNASASSRSPTQIIY